MQKTLFLFLAVCLTLAGCSKPSATWSAVRSVRVDTRDSEDPSATYAEQVSGVLQSANVEHKIVTYQFHYRTALREEAISTRTAVLYRDDRNPNNPWWLTDEQLFKPVWLPGEDENRQISFFLHRPATVVSTRTIGEGDNKRVIGAPDLPTTPAPMVARLEPVKRTERSRWWPRLFGPRRPETQQLVAGNIKPAFGWAPVHRRTDPTPVTSSSTRYAALFFARHGSEFDPASVTDRRKMEQLLLNVGTRHAGL